MEQDRLISFETAKLLRYSKLLLKDVLYYYTNKGKLKMDSNIFIKKLFGYFIYPCITQNELKQYLHNKYDIEIIIDASLMMWTVNIFYKGNKVIFIKCEPYEEVLEKALCESIKLVKKNEKDN